MKFLLKSYIFSYLIQIIRIFMNFFLIAISFYSINYINDKNLLLSKQKKLHE
jgi:hypothetical protein